jgi:hypothetical protein
MHKYLALLLAWSSFGIAAPHCSFEFSHGLFFEARVDEDAKRIFLTGPHQSYEAPFAKASNPSETTWWAAFGKGRTLEVTENQDGRKICLDDKSCFKCK